MLCVTRFLYALQGVKEEDIEAMEKWLDTKVGLTCLFALFSQSSVDCSNNKNETVTDPPCRRRSQPSHEKLLTAEGGGTGSAGRE